MLDRVGSEALRELHTGLPCLKKCCRVARSILASESEVTYLYPSPGYALYGTV